jgi:hypothetical protein
MKAIIVLVIILSLNASYSQERFAYQQERHIFNRSLINKNIVNRISKKRFEKGYEYEAKYLGKFKTKTGSLFYIVNSSYVHLSSLQNENQIFIYDSKKKFVGYYNLATNYQLPVKLSKNILFFKVEACPDKVILENGIPKLICIGCKDEKDCLEFQ